MVIVHSEATRGHARPHAGLEWHFWVGYDGYVEQLVDTERRADANYHANSFAISIETEDDGDPDRQPWREAQLMALVDLIDWCCVTHNIPKAEPLSWFGSGVGYHTMWGAPSPWTPVAKTCPGKVRKAQWPGLMAELQAPHVVLPKLEVPPRMRLIYPHPVVDQKYGAGWLMQLLEDGAIWMWGVPGPITGEPIGANGQPYFTGEGRLASALDVQTDERGVPQAWRITDRTGSFYHYGPKPWEG